MVDEKADEDGLLYWQKQMGHEKEADKEENHEIRAKKEGASYFEEFYNEAYHNEGNHNEDNYNEDYRRAEAKACPS